MTQFISAFEKLGHSLISSIPIVPPWYLGLVKRIANTQDQARQEYVLCSLETFALFFFPSKPGARIEGSPS